MTRRHRVVALVEPPQSTFELAIAAEVFGIKRAGVPARYDFRVCTARPGRVATLAGYEMVIDAGLDALRRADTVVIVGWPGRDAAPPAEIVDAVRQAHRRGARVAAICSGAFLLAATGLLDGRAATTHWSLADALSRLHPAMPVEPDVLYIDHGDISTSAGTSAGIDLCLHLVRTDHGAAYAALVARAMVMPPHRDGGQLQYAGPVPDRPPESLAPLLDWVLDNLARDLTVDDIARHAGWSARTLARRFAEQVGTSPGRWLIAQRVSAARVLLEQSELTVDVIADRVGLSSATNLRRRFQQQLRTTPGAYRRNFAVHSAD